jgi:hypothetical protein
MPTSSRYHTTLTNYARGLANDIESALASYLAPEVIVSAAVGQYKAFSDKNAFQTPNTARAIGGPARRLHFEATDPTYNCRPHALELPIDDHERDEAGEGDPLRLEEAKTQTLISSAVASHEIAVFSAAAAAVAPTPGGAWSGSANEADPIAEIDALIEEIATNTGRMPNRLILGLPAWSILRHNPQVIARFPGAAQVGVTLKQFASLLLNPEIEPKVGTIAYDQNNWGQGANIANVIGSELYVYYGSSRPTLYDASFMKTFRTRRGGVDTVRLYREENARSDILAVDWTQDVQVTAAPAGRRLTIT